MIDEPIDFGSAQAWNVPASLLVDDVARLCVAAGMELCAVYPAQGSRDPIAFERGDVLELPLRETVDFDQFISTAQRFGFSIVRESIVVGGAERAYVVFGSRGRPLSAALVRSACELFASAIAQTERLAYYHRVSDRLQRALLPSRLAQAPGLAFDAAYSPGSTEAEVGGDWYDAFEIGNGRICISVGDVTGHGLEAAITMSELRRAIRTSAVAHESPTAALNAVDAIASSQGIGIASAIVGFFDPASALLCYACAGHPPPVFLTAQGRAYAVPGGGTLLGLGIGCASPERTLTLSSGTSVLFYTDGLIEYDRDLFAGETRLLDAVEALASEQALCGRALHDRVLENGPRDDCATLILSRERHAAHAREIFRFSAIPSSARLMRDAIRDFTERCGIVDERQFGALVACGEAIANGIEHGDQEPGTAIALEMAFDGEALVVEIESRGHWRSSSSENRGRGIGIMRAYAQRLELSSSSDRTRVSLVF